MRRLARLSLALAVVVALAGPADATVWYGRLTHIDAEHFQPHGDGGGWHVTRSARTLGLGQSVFGTYLSYARNPVVWTEKNPAEAEMTDLLTLRIQSAVGFGPVDLALDLPLHLLMSGDIATWDETYRESCFGNLRFSPKVMFLDPRKRVLGIGLALPLSFPTTSEWKVRTEFAFTPTLAIEGDFGLVRIGGNIGVRLPVEDDLISKALVFSAAVSIHPLSALDFTAELHGNVRGPAAIYGDERGPLDTPVEWLAGLSLHPLPPLTIAVAGGTRIGRGIPAPDGRLMLAFSVAPPRPTGVKR